MNVRFKITSAHLSEIREDLRRPHKFAYERVGFILAGLAQSESRILALAQSYRPVADEDYLRDDSVAAMMGPDAIRKAMEWALIGGAAIFHVHSHGGIGLPRFSGIDLRENSKFVPDFVKAAPQNLHGAIVLSDDAAAGLYWTFTTGRAAPITEFLEVGRPLLRWQA
jgi:hypothetical protein